MKRNQSVFILFVLVSLVKSESYEISKEQAEKTSHSVSLNFYSDFKLLASRQYNQSESEIYILEDICDLNKVMEKVDSDLDQKIVKIDFLVGKKRRSQAKILAEMIDKTTLVHKEVCLMCLGIETQLDHLNKSIKEFKEEILRFSSSESPYKFVEKVNAFNIFKADLGKIGKFIEAQKGLDCENYDKSLDKYQNINLLVTNLMEIILKKMEEYKVNLKLVVLN